MGSLHLLQQNVKQKDEKLSSVNQVIQEREQKLTELENRWDFFFIVSVRIAIKKAYSVLVLSHVSTLMKCRFLKTMVQFFHS